MTSMVDNLESTNTRVPWWAILLTGIAALVLGFLLLTEPGMTSLTLVQFLGAYWFVSGLFSIVAIFTDRRRWGWKLLLGIVGILAGLSVLRHPIVSAILIPTLIVTIVAIEGIIYGIVGIIQGVAERSWGLGVLGILSAIFGVSILLSPVSVALTLPFIIGILALIGGVVAVVDSFRIRGTERTPAPYRPSYGQQIPVTGPDDKPGEKKE